MMMQHYTKIYGVHYIVDALSIDPKNGWRKNNLMGWMACAIDQVVLAQNQDWFLRTPNHLQLHNGSMKSQNKNFQLMVSRKMHR